MKKKGLVAMGLAGVMTIGMCVPVLADTDVTSDKGTGDANITYTEPEVYSVTIPATITMASADTKQDISILVAQDTLKLASGKKLRITSSVDTDLNLVMTEKDNTTTINAEVTKPNTDSNYFDKDHKNPVKYEIQKPSTVDYAGEYTGTITFTVSEDTGV